MKILVQIILNKLGNGAAEDGTSVGLNLGLDGPGLGIFDAFFTSLSMILVSEVCLLLPHCCTCHNSRANFQ